MQTSRSFDADPEELAEVRRFVRRSAEEARLPDETTDALILSVYEAAANSILHSGSERFHLRWLALEDRVEIEIRDEGIFRRRVRIPVLEGYGGLGMPLMMSFADVFELHEGTRSRPGTRVRLVKFRGSPVRGRAVEGAPHRR